LESALERERGCAAIAVEKGVEAAGEVEGVIDLLRGFRRWRAVLEVERADPRFDLIRGRYRLRHLEGGLSERYLAKTRSGQRDRE
jgi:hypothetical protein